jgi:hypothetical protein
LDKGESNPQRTFSWAGSFSSQIRSHPVDDFDADADDLNHYTDWNAFTGEENRALNDF